MGRADDRKPSSEPIPQHSRMDEQAQIKRTEAFLAATQGSSDKPGVSHIYGTGKPPDGKPKGRKS